MLFSDSHKSLNHENVIYFTAENPFDIAFEVKLFIVTKKVLTIVWVYKSCFVKSFGRYSYILTIINYDGKPSAN